MPRYFKLVALSDPEWLFSEFRAGRARFGWSWPGSDLRELAKKAPAQRSAAERIVWRYTKFLLQRIRPGDRLVLQFEAPLRQFLIAEVTDEGYDSSDPEREDFNHILHVLPLTPTYVPINAKLVSVSLKHDLTKRGQYYEIYNQSSIDELERSSNSSSGLTPS